MKSVARRIVSAIRLPAPVALSNMTAVGTPPTNSKMFSIPWQTHSLFCPGITCISPTLE